MSEHEFSNELSINAKRIGAYELTDADGFVVGCSYREAYNKHLDDERPDPCRIVNAEANARLWSKADKLLEACEMGRADLWHGGTILRAAAAVIQSNYDENPASVTKLIKELLAKATAEDAALKAARGEDA